MADRLFALFALIAGGIYTYVAFFVIKAPFQYDPLGPETWPQVLAVVFLLCSLYVLVRPDHIQFSLGNSVSLRLLMLVVMLAGYAELYQPLGFVISTALFCCLLSVMLGANRLHAVAFGCATGIFGYGICDYLLGLNLPEGLLAPLL
ncbi:MAG: tripartite tricarboxylate transporter TctB family protein [Thalassospira sp.]|uniref:tripartite tricarboxylate transporter TctB family protein n=2 Tax=Thalassospira sp. TaxID=1912094 RepID=UPI001AFEB913|nr:tripartite tricarboxylate transporter TctB family protein [Thalassospira sp.]MBO6804145.1 tripartite tricarboxylate transporter TctB family protein [Thalassospira sp.]MBO6817165.1 tripartite tricarboxylate transporter TctB family protein [Thalassospira sp.]MBO6888555.1 tripartite tricarboxylate transporter TctB family protein [Thalassospira sp.]